MSREKLNSSLDGELNDADREALERALAADPSLRSELDELRALDAELRDVYAGAAGDAEAVIRKFRVPEPKKNIYLWIALPLAAAAGFVAGIFINPHINNPQPEEPPGKYIQKVAEPPAEDTITGMITLASGPFVVRSEGAPAREAHAREILYIGQTVEMPGNVRAECVLRSGTEIRMDRGTILQLNKRDSIAIETGRLHLLVRGAGPLELRAGDQTFSANSAELQINKKGDEIQINILQGSAEFGLGKAAETIAAGEYLYITKKGVIQRTRLRESGLRSAWTVELDALEGGRDREIVNSCENIINELKSLKSPGDESARAWREAASFGRISAARLLNSSELKDDTAARRRVAKLLLQIGDPSIAAEIAAGMQDSDLEIRKSCAAALEAIAASNKGFDISKYSDSIRACKEEDPPVK